MNYKHVISDEVLEEAQMALNCHHYWIAYNTIPYFLEQSDVYFFKQKEEAQEFSENNISEYDNFAVIHAWSLQDFFKLTTYEEALKHYLSKLKNLSIMNENNFDYLNKQVKYTGFGEDHQAELKQKMEQKLPEFTIFHQSDFGKDNTGATLYFKKSDESDMYFFNRYNLELKNQQQVDPIKQTFYINNREDNITLKEGYNLMNGRAVHKELATRDGEKYNAWLQLDFKETDKHDNYKMKQFHQNYGYDLEKALAKHPLKELSNETDKTRLIESLERGNRQSVTFQHAGKEQKIFIEASPQFKSLNFYDGNMQRVNMQTLYEKKGEAKAEQQDAKKESQKQDKAGSDEEGEVPNKSQKKSRKKGQGIS